MLNVLHKPISYKEAQGMLDAHGRITATVPIDLDHLFLGYRIDDVIDFKVFTDTYMKNVNYKAVGVGDNGQTIWLEVSGTPAPPDEF